MVPPTTSPQSESSAPPPGRSARSQRTRAAVVDALLDLLRDGNLRPTAKEIAERAGTSLRSVYVHFDDLEDLFCAAASRAVTRIAALAAVLGPTGALDERLDAFVAQRARIYEGLGEVRHAAMLQEPFSPTLAALLAEGRRRTLIEFETVFAPELAALDADTLATTVAACDALGSGASWDHWRHHQGHSVEAASAALRHGLHRLLAPR